MKLFPPTSITELFVKYHIDLERYVRNFRSISFINWIISMYVFMYFSTSTTFALFHSLEQAVERSLPLYTCYLLLQRKQSRDYFSLLPRSFLAFIVKESFFVDYKRAITLQPIWSLNGHWHITKAIFVLWIQNLFVVGLL